MSLFPTPSSYPVTPPNMFFVSSIGEKMHPNLNENGVVCVSLLGTWSGENGGLNLRFFVWFFVFVFVFVCLFILKFFYIHMYVYINTILLYPSPWQARTARTGTRVGARCCSCCSACTR